MARFLLALIATSVALSQQRPQFEVASVKPNRNGNSVRPRFPFSALDTAEGIISSSPASLSMRDVTLKSCIKWAYNVQDSQVSGPEWLTIDRFDVIAKAPAPASNGQLKVMLQTLLAERFKVAFHRESKTLGGYGLVVGKNGAKLKPSQDDGEPEVRGQLRIEVRRYSMPDLAELLSMSLGSAEGIYVADMTGLNGRFSFTIDISPFLAVNEPVLRNEATAVMSSAFQRALEQQLGLRLEGRKIPVDVLVIDHAEKPSEN
jgi:uncharacterized protein (TIGR03435 family)